MLYEVVYGDYYEESDNYLTTDKQDAIRFAEEVYEKVKEGRMCDYVTIQEFKLGSPCRPTTGVIWVFSYEDHEWYGEYNYSEQYLEFKKEEISITLGKLGADLLEKFIETLDVSKKLCLEIINRNVLAYTFITDEEGLNLRCKEENLNTLLSLTFFREDWDRSTLKDSEIDILKDSYNIFYH